MIKNAFVHSRMNDSTMKIDSNVKLIDKIKMVQTKIIRLEMTTQ